MDEAIEEVKCSEWHKDRVGLVTDESEVLLMWSGVGRYYGYTMKLLLVQEEEKNWDSVCMNEEEVVITFRGQ